MKLQKISDKAAIGISALCIVHCLLLPLLLLALPGLAVLAVLSDEAIHEALLFAIVPISLVALTAGYHFHRSKTVLMFGAAGIGLLMLVPLLGHDNLNKMGEVILTVMGSGALIYGHIKNLTLRGAETPLSPATEQ